jgi:uncharacterized membrane-anchored protein
MVNIVRGEKFLIVVRDEEFFKDLLKLKFCRFYNYIQIHVGTKKKQKTEPFAFEQAVRY